MRYLRIVSVAEKFGQFSGVYFGFSGFGGVQDGRFNPLGQSISKQFRSKFDRSV